MNALESLIDSGYKNAMSYEEFRKLIDVLLEQNLVTGENQQPELIPYSAMNVQRMNRLDKHYQVGNEIMKKISSIENDYTFLTITEGWCGDSSQIIPVIEKIAALSPHIRSLYILRDENSSIMDLFLTNGTRSIPITICIENSTGMIVWKYGSRPSTAATLVRQYKEAGMEHEEMSEKLHLWYARNRQQEIEEELGTLIEKMS